VTLEYDRSKTWWYEVFHDKLYKDSNLAKFNLGRKLFNKRAIKFLSIDDNEVEATIDDGRKTTFEVKISFGRLKYFEAEALEDVFRNNMIMVSDLMNGFFSHELQKIMSDRGIDIFPGWEDLTYKCSCRKAKKCEHVATVLHRIFNETIFEPMLIFALRGITGKNAFSILLSDPDFEPAESHVNSELTIDHYQVKSSNCAFTGIDTLDYYGTEFGPVSLTDIKPSGLTDAMVFHGKMRDEFYEIFDGLTEVIRLSLKKY
jgi:uncharacterized Zn finger protein